MAARITFAIAGALAMLLASAVPAAALGPYWHVDTFNAANLSGMSGNRAMWSGVPGGTPGYATAPGYGNNWDDHLYWRTTVANPTQTTTVRLRFDFNYDLQLNADFLRVERQVAGTWVLVAQISGSNKNMMGQFIDPATFDQTWTLGPGQYAGPHGNQVVMRLRVLTNGSASDQDGGYNSSGAVQVDNVVVELNGVPVSQANFDPSGSDGGWTPFDRQAVADYVRDTVLGGNYQNVVIRMTPYPVDQSHVARDLSGQVPNLPMPYAQTWMVLIDDLPNANWGHPCRWVAVRADLGAHAGPLNRSMPPAVLGAGGSGPQVPVDCGDFTPLACPPIDNPPSVGPGPIGEEAPCLHAVLISGGLTPDDNHRNYRTNLSSMYKKLIEIGYLKENIDVYYADGASLDLDNLDGDNSHATGNDVTDAARVGDIRDRISGLCSTLDPRRDVLFIYTTNHGGESTGWLMLYFLEDEPTWWYTQTDFDADTRNCDVSRLFVLMDQCFSGSYASIATDGEHANMAFFAAAEADEFSYAREYMAEWEDLDPTALTMNEMHAEVVAGSITSTPVMAEGSAGIGDTFLNQCGALETCYVTEVATFCATDASKDAFCVVCNLTDEEHSYDVAFAGDPADAAAGCSEDGPVGFTPLDPLPLVIPPVACARVRVRIDRPAGLNALFETACYTATVTNLERGNTLLCHGSVLDRRDLCPEWNAAEGYQFIPTGQPRTLTLRLKNTLPMLASELKVVPTAVPYRFEVVPAEVDGVPEDAVGLNGNAPNVPVSGIFTLPPPGGTVELPITMQYAQPDTEFFHVLRFLADVNGDSQMEMIATMGLRQLGQGTVGVTLQVEIARPRLRVSPNPARGSVVLYFDVPGSEAGACRLEVMDLLGRRVRLLPGGSGVQGPQRVVWDTSDDVGRRVASGVYLVRLTTPLGARQVKAVVLQ